MNFKSAKSLDGKVPKKQMIYPPAPDILGMAAEMPRPGPEEAA